MSKKISYKYHIVMAMIFSLSLAGVANAQTYNISGVLDFTYQHYDAKIGNSHTTSHQATQHYAVNVGSYVLDPRILAFNAGVGYSITSSSGGSDFTTLNYDLNAKFFPGMLFSWDLFGRKSSTRYETTGSLSGVDVNTTSYGGTIHMNLSRLGTGRKNNNNNNNSFDNSRFPLPDITLSRTHTQSESLGSRFPLDETRDDTSANVLYHIFPSTHLIVNGELSEYENTQNGSSYDTKTLNAQSKTIVSSTADFNIDGRFTEKSPHNISGYDSATKVWSLDTKLYFKEKDRLRHSYGYQYLEQETAFETTTAHRANTEVYYRLQKDVQIHGGLEYSQQERNLKLTGYRDQLQSGGATGGILYAREFTPEFLNPFVLNTSYDFVTGFSSFSTNRPNVNSGGGIYFLNSAVIGLNSAGWEKENLQVNLSFSDRRDDSALHNNIQTQNYRVSFLTSRIPKTSVCANASYQVQEAKSDGGNSLFVNTSGFSQQQRQSNYDVSINHAVTNSFILSAGATRGQSNSSITYSTLNALQMSTVHDVLETYYAAANFSYVITRNMTYRAQLRDTYYDSHSGVDSQVKELRMNLDWRIRQLYASLEYRLMESEGANSPQAQQQSYMVKIVRPF